MKSFYLSENCNRNINNEKRNYNFDLQQNDIEYDFYAKTISNCPIHILKKTMQFNKEYVLLLRNVDK